jgi:predicted RNase H-like nuclease
MGQDGAQQLMNTRFIGLDLAWSPRNNSAAVALEADGPVSRWVAHAERLRDNAEVLEFVSEAAGSGVALVAIDAPLIVPNEEGARPVDRQITSVFGRYGGGCYPAYRNRPGTGTRGEDIVAALAEYGFLQDPYVQKRAAVRAVFEVYPHPAMLALFRLDTTLKYKARPGRSLDLRRSELTRLRDHLGCLQQRKPAMSLPTAVVQRDIDALRGAALKRYEDLLDATMCAYIAHYAWYWGPSGYHVYGDTAHGYILVPTTRWMQKRLAERTMAAQRLTNR